jgi:hypothetical protein
MGRYSLFTGPSCAHRKVAVLRLSHRRPRAYRVDMDITLSPGAHLQWRCPRAIELQVCTGRLWLTQLGEVHDRFAEAGDAVRLPARCRVVLGAEGPEPLRLRGRFCAPAAPPWPFVPDVPAYRRRARRQREVAKRWWWRCVTRRVRAWCAVSSRRPG